MKNDSINKALYESRTRFVDKMQHHLRDSLNFQLYSFLKDGTSAQVSVRIQDRLWNRVGFVGIYVLDEIRQRVGVHERGSPATYEQAH